ncbi:YlxR family protein [Mycoplasma tullyi]|uniref:YlxR family protein n=1 Tax=Mycoplasma tullyi TaxID=1612150 RepID=A0A7D7YKG0_9MOLU|nr:YlxR family protein [Mycoplasma tullyi]QMT98621.1 YlxR family protein [Mycoplasma tullyi]
MKKIIQRFDLITKKQLPVNQLYRIVFYQNQLLVDFDYKIKARGVYLNKNEQIIIDKKIKALIQKSFKTKILDEQFNHLSDALRKRGQDE